MNNFRFRTTIATALLLIAGVWTVGAKAQSTSGRWVRISAFTNTPVADADIVVSDRDGRVVFEKDRVTNDRGFYAAEIHPVPKRFRVTVTSDGMKLSSDVNDYDPVHGEIFVNPVTTMVSRLLDRRPELSLARAQAIIRSFLGMPANASLGAAMREGPYYQSPVFSESAFLKEAKAYGGVDSYLESLVTQAIYHPNEMHRFRTPQSPLTSSTADAAAVFMAAGLAQSAFSFAGAGGIGMGWLVVSSGIAQPGATKADIEKLQAGLESVQASVDALSAQLAQATAQLINAINYAQYNTLSIQALDLAVQVDGVENELAVLSDGCPPLPASSTNGPAGALVDFCKSQKALVTKDVSETQIHLAYERLANAYLLDSAVGTKGLLHLFSLCTGQSAGHFFRTADSARIQDMWFFWDTIETAAANLKVELWHLQNAQTNNAGKKELADFLGTYGEIPPPTKPTDGTLQNTRRQENLLVWQPLPDGTAINTKDHTMWFTSYPGSTTYSSCRNAFSGYTNKGGGAWTEPQPYTYLVPPCPDCAALAVRSPTHAELIDLMYEWPGPTFPLNYWLVNQTETRKTDTYPSIPFPIVDGVPSCTSNGPWVWSLESTGSASNFWVLNFNNGTFADAKSQIGEKGKWNWVFVVHPLDPSQEYYWWD